MLNVERRKFSLRKNDQVQVIAGREKGKTGKILQVNSKTGRVTVENVNWVTRHTKANSRGQNSGGIIRKEHPLEYSNVLLLCPKCNRGVRHGQKIVEKAKTGSNAQKNETHQVKVRVCKRCGETLDLA